MVTFVYLSFYANVVKLAPLIFQLAYSLVSFISILCRVSLAEYILVLRVYLPLVADDTFFSGCCVYCLLPAGDED